MKPTTSKEDVFFIYDGECPICQMAARGLRIREAVGTLQLINAREKADHPVMQEIKEKGLNLDQGMVIKFKHHCYQGKDALYIMALLGTNTGWFNRMNAMLFRSKFFASLCYPPMKATRNLLLRIKHVPPIHNLETHDPQIPIFQPIFGQSWHSLPEVMHKHYANRPYSHDVVTVKGVMDVTLGKCTRRFAPLLQKANILPFYEEKDIPVTVHFHSEPDSKAYLFDRIFYFKNKEPYHFRSRMVPVGGNEVIEFMRFGVGWHATYTYQNEKILLQHKGYVLRCFGLIIPLPLSLIIGKGYAEEQALTKHSFAMYMDITHPLWGKMYAYKGTFTVVEKNDE